MTFSKNTEIIESKMLGGVAVHKIGPDDWKEKIVVMSWGDITSIDHQIASFLFSQYQVYVIDPPGTGASTGNALPQRSD